MGLRLSARRGRDARPSPARWRSSRTSCAAQTLYVFTINGFPYGPFHGTRVKEEVYLPDWRDAARLDYTNLLADLLAQLLPRRRSTARGSISTVPGAFKPHADSAGRQWRAWSSSCCATRRTSCRSSAHRAAHRARARARALLPPRDRRRDGAFFREHLHSAAAAARLGELTGLDAAAAARRCGATSACASTSATRRSSSRIPRQCLQALEAAGIAMAKIQVTAGLRIPRVDARTSADALRRFDDAVYLHQVVERSAGRACGASPTSSTHALASAAGASGDCEWRVHFHVPVFLETLDALRLDAGVRARGAGAAPAAAPFAAPRGRDLHLGGAARAQYRTATVEEAIARELDVGAGNCLA